MVHSMYMRPVYKKSPEIIDQNGKILSNNSQDRKANEEMIMDYALLHHWYPWSTTSRKWALPVLSELHTRILAHFFT